MIEVDDIFPVLVDLPANEWNAVATKVMWQHRVGMIDEWPHILRSIPHTVSDLESWKAYRNRVNKARRAQAQRIRRERKTVKAQSRKQYMRKYMTKYRHPSID
jgi:hypothetical protein